MLSEDYVRLYEANNVPINTAGGKNSGTYSNKRVHASASVVNASGLDGRRSTKVTAKIMPQITSITRKKPEKNRRIKNLNKIRGLNICFNS